MDPVLRLPPEITAEIFSYLDPSTLHTASLASRGWRARITDPRLWKAMYIREGWRVDVDAITKFEQLHTERFTSQIRKSRSRNSDPEAPEPQLKRRVTEASIQSRDLSGNATTSEPPWNEQHQVVEADVPTSPHDGDGDQEMQDVNAVHHSCPPSESQSDPTSSVRHSPLIIRYPNGTAKINWPYLYKQRRRLEDNWIKGRFTTFALPHPTYSNEAHQQCVYAFQFSGKWLVSGSRDTTVRIWDLSRMRLSLPPLRGHRTSVLCLQFDPSEDEDLIMSGGSDRKVILWRFSTGKKLLELNNAHQDSVLNLKFDKRYLVTCSKDKLVKIWNRQTLSPLDKDYPTVVQGVPNKYPSYIIDTSQYSPSWLEAHLANGQIKPLEPYSLLMTLEGHTAAVNALQMNEDEVISAAGDRLIKIWNIHNGMCLRTCVGHQKGIACVQIDNRRIISGSNDDTVRIYDHVTAAEVACLEGHSNLVRAVQAGFGDPPGAEENLRMEALAVDNEFWEAQRKGTIALQFRPTARQRRTAVRNAGSRHPSDITALGAHIPPGGGGSRWARIVSGSYDETVIIWRKDRDGRWLIGHRLRQADAVLMANTPASIRAREQAMRYMNMSQSLSRNMSVLSPPEASSSSIAANVAGNANANADNSNDHLVVNNAAQGLADTASRTVPELTPAGSSAASTAPTVAATVAATPTGTAPTGAGVQAHPNAAPLSAAQAVNIAAQAPDLLAHLMVANAAAARHPNGPLTPLARIYKLQFDARKIICASQDSRIVGWDFAAGDEAIMEASQFFVGV